MVLARSDQFPLQGLYAGAGTSPRAGSVHGMGVGRGVEVSVAEAVGVGENVGVAKSGAF